MADNPTARIRELGARLWAAREAAGVGRTELARSLGLAMPTVARFELGRREPTRTNLALMLGYCRVPAEESAYILDLAEASRHKCWVRPHGSRLPEAVPSVLFQYQAANAIACYDPHGIPPLFQSVDYIDADLGRRCGDGIEVSEHRLARKAYRGLLVRDNRPRAVCYLHESALRSLPVDEETRRSQLLALVMASGSNEATIRVVPVEHEHAVGAAGFSSLRFDEYPPLVVQPAETVTLIVEGPEHIAAYAAAITRLTRLALSELDSRELLCRLSAE
jgi:transcriptional regulator with XRE-family HTH domain